MFRYFNATGMLLLVAVFCLLLNGGCQSAGVIIGEEPPYRHEPPPPPAREPGPPPWAPAHGYRAKHHYRYYPSSYVYYDTGRNLYCYYESGNWRVAVSLPTRIHLDMDNYVSLDMNTDKPYEYHTEVVRRYPPGHIKQKSKGKGKGKGKWD